MSAAATLVRLLREPETAAALNAESWTGVITAAHAESLLGTLAARCQGLALPDAVRARFDDVLAQQRAVRRGALWEAECARRALAPLGVPVILLKGTAYIAAGLEAGQGRNVGDLDILVPWQALPAVEAALIDHGWEWVKPDPYDDDYYRRWMHELPPLIHRARDTMIDVHHTILPRTAGPTPDAAALIADAVPLAGEDGLKVLSPADMVCHCAAHLIADGDLQGGPRNLWDMDRLVREFAASPDFWATLPERARLHGLEPAVARGLRLARRLYGTPVDEALAGRDTATDRLFAARMLARNGWGQETRKLLGFGFYLRSHLLRMPPGMLARHLATKALKGYRPPR